MNESVSFVAVLFCKNGILHLLRTDCMHFDVSYFISSRKMEFTLIN